MYEVLHNRELTALSAILVCHIAAGYVDIFPTKYIWHKNCTVTAFTQMSNFHTAYICSEVNLLTQITVNIVAQIQ